MARSRRVLLCLAGASLRCEGLITRLQDALPHLPVLVVGLSEAIPPDATQQIVDLTEVDRPAIGALVDAMLPLHPSLRARFLDAAAGAPATVIWTVRGWLADRKLTGSEQGLRLTEDLALPTDPGGAIQRLGDRATP
jgi:hypothetical protein